MKQTRKRRISLLLSLVLILALFTFTGCGDKDFENYRPIDDLTNLDGRKIGVGIGWCSDYLLSSREDLILYRYDSVSDMLLALCYKQLDAVAVDLTTARQILALTTGLRQAEGQLTMDSILAYVASDEEELSLLFNDWLKEFRRTDRYKDWLKRFYAFDGNNYEWSGEELTGTGRKVIMATYADWYPFCYINQDGEAEGFEVEFMHMFANDMNFDLEIIGTAETDMMAGIDSEIYDLVFGNLSILYKGDALAAGLFVTDCFYEQPVVVLEIADPDNLGISGADVL